MLSRLITKDFQHFRCVSGYCPGGCFPGEFSCLTTGQCVPSGMVCDGVPQCEDLSDEIDCNARYTRADSTCSATEFRCASDNTCIPLYMQCDGRAQCRDLSDEYNCIKTFKCLNSVECIPVELVCDGISHCPDDSDEINCPFVNPA